MDSCLEHCLKAHSESYLAVLSITTYRELNLEAHTLGVFMSFERGLTFLFWDQMGRAQILRLDYRGPVPNRLPKA